MNYNQNLHTHTTYCDGKDTPREVIEIAIKKGFTSVGFSEHSYMHYSPYHSMMEEKTPEYIKQIKALKDEYKGTFDVYCGIEFDMYSMLDLSPFDYVIGSFHYFHIGDEYVGFDRSQDEVAHVINTYFDGNGMAYAKKYYHDLAMLPSYGKIDVLGHFDLVAKHSDNTVFFDGTSKEYLSYAVEAAEVLFKKVPLFEVNTGAISRGYRKTPYPSLEILKELKRIGFGAIISSDCHDANTLECGFDSAKELLQEAGFREKFILTDDGFVPTAL